MDWRIRGYEIASEIGLAHAQNCRIVITHLDIYIYYTNKINFISL